MPLVYQHNINGNTRLGVWRIEEDENFFLETVPLGKGIQNPLKRLQHLAGRYLLHELFPGFPYSLIEIADTNKPFLPNEEYHFSISHSRNYAAALVSKDKRVGIDIEICSDKVVRVKNKFLHPTELQFVGEDIITLTLLWCVKESMFKWYGLGGIDFRDHLRIEPFVLHQNKTIKSKFLKQADVDLNVEYRIEDEFVLAWCLNV